MISVCFLLALARLFPMLMCINGIMCINIVLLGWTQNIFYPSQFVSPCGPQVSVLCYQIAKKWENTLLLISKKILSLFIYLFIFVIFFFFYPDYLLGVVTWGGGTQKNIPPSSLSKTINVRNSEMTIMCCLNALAFPASPCLWHEWWAVLSDRKAGAGSSSGIPSPLCATLSLSGTPWVGCTEHFCRQGSEGLNTKKPVDAPGASKGVPVCHPSSLLLPQGTQGSIRARTAGKQPGSF